MDSEDTINKSDFFLRDIPSVKTSIDRKPQISKNHVKEEMQVLRLSDNSQAMVMETLKHIHGQDFKLTDASGYEDKGLNLKKKYWLSRGTLVVKGGFDYSANNIDNVSAEDQFKMFALLRLESYGFHRNHCIEALDYCNSELEEALYLLYSKLMKIDEQFDVPPDISENYLLEQRRDEKSVLESIYEKAFEEKIANSVWKFNFKLSYLVNLYRPSSETTRRKVNVPSDNKKMCRGFLQGNCKFGSKCRFSHEEEPKNKNDDANSHLGNYNFELEIRFPSDTKYPFEPPIIFLKTDFSMPPLTCLHICKRLYEEANVLAKYGTPSVYSIVELLLNEEEITSYLKNTKIDFLAPDEKLFPVESKPKLPRPSHYKKGATTRDNKKELSFEAILEEDKRIVQKFQAKIKEASYLKMQQHRKKLPAWNLMNDILNAVKSSQVTVICGDTGCGKSTQIPQYLLDEWLTNYKNDKRSHVEIVCTQPRRISAIGVAERVADERCERVGNTVGYQIRLESKISISTRLTFCTTGILLRRLESDPTLQSVSYIIVDEVHERSEESDFLLLILKDLTKIRPDLKIILMSATINPQLFSDYFGGIPILNIPGRTFPVEQFFLEEILETTGCVLEENTQFTRKVAKGEDLTTDMELAEVTRANAMPKDSIKDERLTMPQLLARYEGYSMKTCKNLFMVDPEKINMDLIESILVWIVSGDHKYPKEGSILIFLPGIAEIKTLYDQLCDHPEFSPRHGKYVLVPLHSSLSSEEQAAVFRKPRTGCRKIVLSTNLAETSITIDDCVFVIDSGKMKEKRFDSNRNMESLDLVWVTKANALQRKGRAGRVMPGVCIHLFTSHRFKHHLLPQPVPEMHRIPLEQLLLNIKVLPNFGDNNLYEILGSVIEPPGKENIDSAVVRLQDVGAFDKNNNLTALGQHLAALPVDVRIGKLMLYGAIFCCVDAALTMAACLSYKSPFVSPFGKKDLANAKKRNFAVGNSDHLTVLRAYKKWQEMNAKSRLAGRNFANENYLSIKTLETIADMKYQLLELLVSIGFVPVDLSTSRHRSGEDKVLALTGSELNSNAENVRLLMAVLCAALYPNIVKVLTPQKSFISSAVGAVPKDLEAKELKLRTKDGEVFLHPSSINFISKSFPSSFLVYQEKVKTNKVYIRDSAVVPVVALVLFSGGDVDINVHDGNTFLSFEEGWIVFQALEHRIAEMIKAIRVELLDLLEEKIKDPLLNLWHHDKGERIISTIVHLVTND